MSRLIALALLLVGCGSKPLVDPCSRPEAAGKTCVGTLLGGAAGTKQVPQVVISVNGSSTTSFAVDTPETEDAPYGVTILVDNPGKISVVAAGMNGGDMTAKASADVVIAEGEHRSLSLTLTPLSSPTPPPPDMGGPDLTPSEDCMPRTFHRCGGVICDPAHSRWLEGGHCLFYICNESAGSPTDCTP